MVFSDSETSQDRNGFSNRSKDNYSFSNKKQRRFDLHDGYVSIPCPIARKNYFAISHSQKLDAQNN